MSQLAGPAALFAGLYCVSRSADFRAVGQGRDYRAPPLGETFASLRDHITLERPGIQLPNLLTYNLFYHQKL